MNWAITHNQRLLNLKEIPSVSFPELQSGVIEQINQHHLRLLSFMARPQADHFLFYAILADDETSQLIVASSPMNDKSYQSLTPDIAAFQGFEREIYEHYGIEPIGHPWLKPLRYPFDRVRPSEMPSEYPFFQVEGEGIHQVAVGPIHAGVIEPGHFRFMCHGEKIFHLEIQLGYQHRGIEHLIEQGHQRNQNMIHLAESICGDSVIGHTMAYAGAIECLSNQNLNRRDMAVRSIALELERIAIHLGDLGTIANDIAYLLGNAVFGALRTLVINTSQALCGSRFGRGLIRIGRNIQAPDQEWIENTNRMLNTIDRDFTLMAETMFSAPSVLSRLEKTGILTPQQARDLGMTGPTARASGLSVDCRCDHPFGWYKTAPMYKIKLDSGDVFARTYIRYIEIKQSIAYLQNLMPQIPIQENTPTISSPCSLVAGCMEANSMAVSMVEGWRGEICHIAITDATGKLYHYKIKDPSFHNWHGLALAARNNGISDFPLCNKSFNLSYCGFDL